jgi:isopenicillin-N epimerase
MQRFVEPLVVSWGYAAEKPSASRFVDEQEWTGTRDIAAYLATPDAIRFCEEHHWDEVRAQCHALAQYAREQIGALVRAIHEAPLPPISPDSTDWYMQMVSVSLPPINTAKDAFGRTRLQARLMDEFNIEVPIVVWNGKPYIRVSIQAYNTPEDVDRLVEALDVSLRVP